jgi:outer membrane protein OmpA-like peptidoglycan-associated protein
VTLPSPLVVATNALSGNTTGTFRSGQLTYSGATGSLYAAGPSDYDRRDFVTPLLVLGAHRAVDLAVENGADTQAASEIEPAKAKLSMLDRAWPARGRNLPKDLEAEAHEVMRMAEHARTVAVERGEQARTAKVKADANARAARAENEKDKAKDEAAQANARAEDEKQRSTAAQSAADDARARAEEERARRAAAQNAAEDAQNAADQARAREQVAQNEADRARLEADRARGEKEDLQRRLYESLSSILETRREARGMIVSLSDVLFDFDRASLTGTAREKLSRLVGVLQAYPGSYHLATEGHTDSIGTHDYNLRLSRDRAETVRDYLLTAGVPSDRMGAATGFAATRPVASNQSGAGRQMNRRVEIIITDLDR